MPNTNSKQTNFIKTNWVKIAITLFVVVNITISLTLLKGDILRISLADNFSNDTVFELINKERTNYNLQPLSKNFSLQESANSKALDMANNNYFSHISPYGKKWSQFINDQKYDYSIAGENLAKDYSNPKTMIEAWMNSPSHRENILNNQVTETGISVYNGKLDNKPTRFVVQVFGKPNK
jgi:uncharacterized protein YkwD